MRSPVHADRHPRLAPAAAVFVALGCAGCGWIALGVHAAAYRVTAAGEAGNVVANGERAYVSLAQQGMGVVDAETGDVLKAVPPPLGSESVDDLAVADDLLFVLDARPPGHLSVFSLAEPAALVLRSAPVEVPVGPFSGVAAAGGRVIVSGGTSELTLRTYDRDGRLGADVAKADFGRGQPDVLLAPDGRRAFVSTHFAGPRFGLTTGDVTGDVTGVDPSIVKRGTMGLETIGFTAGGAKPANFPIETALSGEVLLVAYARGLALVDVSDLHRPSMLSELRLDVEPVNVDVRDGTAAVVGSGTPIGLTRAVRGCIYVCMRTTLILRDDLVERAAAMTGIREKTALVHAGLEALLAAEAARRLARLGGSDAGARAGRRRRSAARLAR